MLFRSFDRLNINSISLQGLVNSTAYKLDIPTPRETYILFSDLLDRKDLSVDELEAKIRSKEKSQEIRYPAFVKPMKVCFVRNKLTPSS